MRDVGLDQVIQDGTVEGVIWVCAGDTYAKKDYDTGRHRSRYGYGQDPYYR